LLFYSSQIYAPIKRDISKFTEWKVFLMNLTVLTRIDLIHLHSPILHTLTNCKIFVL